MYVSTHSRNLTYRLKDNVKESRKYAITKFFCFIIWFLIQTISDNNVIRQIKILSLLFQGKILIDSGN